MWLQGNNGLCIFEDLQYKLLVFLRELIDVFIENDSFNFNVKGAITNVNYSSKKFIFLLFINHRLVECQSTYEFSAKPDKDDFTIVYF